MFHTPSPCPSGKHWCLLSEHLARNLAWLLEAAYGDGVERRWYECDLCGYWHITRDPGRRKPTETSESDTVRP